MEKRQKKIILGFVGPIASGKGMACEYLKTRHGAGYTRFSSILRDILGRIYVEKSRNNLQKLSFSLRQTFGDDILALAIAKDVQNDPHTIIAVDGVRRLPDIKYLTKVPGFHLISIDADQEVRYKRINKRGENTDDIKKTFEEFQKDEQNEAEKDIREVQNTAHFQINNNGTCEDLFCQIDAVLEKIKI